jgi:hypothetical protein
MSALLVLKFVVMQFLGNFEGTDRDGIVTEAEFNE